MTRQKFETFKDFYPYYLTEHDNLKCRRLHYIGSSLVMLFDISFKFTNS